MPSLPYIPHDELAGPTPNSDLAADICELSAFFSPGHKWLLSDLRNDVEIGEDEYEDVDEQNTMADILVEAAASTLSHRERLAGDAYPFKLNDIGTQIQFEGYDTWGRQAYLLSLVLSHLRTVTPVLKEADLAPDDATCRNLRIWFQEIAATILAAELRGTGWAFGWPRPDNSSFFTKLTEIWSIVRDGSVHAESPEGSPKHVKDGEVDVIAARPHADGEPGFPIAIAQVATGNNWRDKSVRNTVQNVFFPFWFAHQPASQPVSYHIIPFTFSNEEGRHQTMCLGHILPRLRLCSLAGFAQSAVASGEVTSEGVATYGKISEWLQGYQDANVI